MCNKLTILLFPVCKRIIVLLCAGCFFSINISAQFTVKFVLKNKPTVHINDAVFIAGNFNSWDPDNKQYVFSNSDSDLQLVLKNIPIGLYEFKLTRGGWSKGETTVEGIPISNRQLNVQNDTTIEINVAGWQDDFVTTGKQHSASEHVIVMDTFFAMPQLNRTRRIWLYLPEGYATSKKRYPVLYMQDGQNVFDDFTAGYQEWGVDECLDSLIKIGRQPSIVVGIDKGPQRMHEYNPYDHDKYGTAEGAQYIDFIVNTLKPHIDAHYRTLTSKENTLIAGSSMGGLISLYAVLKYPEVFGKAGIFSPSLFAANKIDSLTDAASNKLSGKYFFAIGEQEGTSFVNDMLRIQEKIGKYSSAMIYALIDKEGLNNEVSWRKWFPVFYNWVMAQGWNIISNKAD